MTTLIKKAGLNLFESLKTLHDKICHDGEFCESVLTFMLSVIVGSIMWLSLAQLSY